MCRDLGEICQESVQYKLRDWLVSRQRYWGVPIPISFNSKGEQFPCAELPLELPEI